MTLIKFEVPDHDCKLELKGYCPVEQALYKNIALLEKQPAAVPHKYHQQGDFLNWIKFYG